MLGRRRKGFFRQGSGLGLGCRRREVMVMMTTLSGLLLLLVYTLTLTWCWTLPRWNSADEGPPAAAAAAVLSAPLSARKLQFQKTAEGQGGVAPASSTIFLSPEGSKTRSKTERYERWKGERDDAVLRHHRTLQFSRGSGNGLEYWAAAAAAEKQRSGSQARSRGDSGPFVRAMQQNPQRHSPSSSLSNPHSVEDMNQNVYPNPSSRVTSSSTGISDPSSLYLSEEDYGDLEESPQRGDYHDSSGRTQNDISNNIQSNNKMMKHIFSISNKANNKNVKSNTNNFNSNRKSKSTNSNKNMKTTNNNNGTSSSHTMTGSSRRLPGAIIIGVKKAGTRALLEFLRIHPDVMAPGPEPHFFDRNHHKGLHWYRSLMPVTLPHQLTMEKTPSYFITSEVPRRVHAMSRDTKLLVVLRDPVTRAISDYVQASSKGDEGGGGGGGERVPLKRFEDMAMIDPRQGIVNTSWAAIRIGVYTKHLEKWFKFFPRRQIHFVSGEQLIEDPAEVLKNVQEFLGLEPFITKEHFYLNATRGFPCLVKNPEQKSKPHCLGKTKGRKHPLVEPRVIDRLRAFYRPFNAKLYRMVGRDFGWS